MHREHRLSIPIGVDSVSIQTTLSILGVLVVLAVIAMAVKQLAIGFVIDELSIKSFTHWPSLFFLEQYLIVPICLKCLRLLLSLFDHLLFVSFLFSFCMGSAIKCGDRSG